MMKRDYQTMLAGIHVPPEVNEGVLAAAEKGKRTVRRPWPQWVSLAACAVVAAAVFAGGMALRPDERGENGAELTACAAGLGANGGVLLESVAGGKPTALEGTVQTLRLSFSDGREEIGTYHLRTEKLRSFTDETGAELLAPALEGETAEIVSGLYAVPADSTLLLWPVAGSHTVSLSQPFGYAGHPAGMQTFHAGIDIPAASGSAVTAALGGTVEETGYDAARGNYLLLSHGDGLTTLYAQCREVLVSQGDTVAGGETIARVGATGMATGPHLHFEVRRDGTAQNPVAYFSGDIRDTLEMK